MMALAVVGSVIAALDVLSHSEVMGMLDHEVAKGVRHTHAHLKTFHNKLWHKHSKDKTDDPVQS